MNINWESTTVDNNTAGAVTTYTLEAVMPNPAPSEVAAGATIIITFPTFTDATFLHQEPLMVEMALVLRQ